MIRYLGVEEVVLLHRAVVAQSGGSAGSRDAGALQSAMAQPRMSFGGRDLYASMAEEAAATGFSLITNHPFIDGNKRIGHLAVETFPVLNGLEITAPVDEQEAVILSIAAGEMRREAFSLWLATRIHGKRS